MMNSVKRKESPYKERTPACVSDIMPPRCIRPDFRLVSRAFCKRSAMTVSERAIPQSDKAQAYSGEAQNDFADRPQQQSWNTVSICLLTASHENSRSIQQRPRLPISLKGKARMRRIAAARLWALFSTHKPQSFV